MANAQAENSGDIAKRTKNHIKRKSAATDVINMKLYFRGKKENAADDRRMIVHIIPHAFMLSL